LTDEVEPTGPPDRPSPSDPWGIWFSRLVQIAGLGIMVYETLVEKVDRPWLLLSAMSMLLGGIGLQALLRWAIGRGIGNLGRPE
jgi:hypothetical protein